MNFVDDYFLFQGKRILIYFSCEQVYDVVIIPSCFVGSIFHWNFCLSICFKQVEGNAVDEDKIFC